MHLIKNQILIIMSWIQELNYRFGLETLIMKKRIIVSGLEPKDTNLIFNLEKVKKIYLDLPSVLIDIMLNNKYKIC